MPVRAVKRVLVVGSGLMGAGIAQVAATAGFRVDLVDAAQKALDGARDRISSSLHRLERAGKLTGSPEDILSRISFSLDLEQVARHADLVIEAIIEALEPKQSLFAKLDKWCPHDVVLATNTSQFRIGQVAEPCSAPQRVIGMHWSNPPPLMMLVEVIVSPLTSGEVLEATLDFIKRCDRSSVVCRKDVPGFISNRMSTVLFMEAARLVDEGIATPADIDAVARLMYGHKMGPISTLDLAGLDTALHVATALSQHYGGDRFTPPEALRALVEKGNFGRKTGAGFYDYESSKP
jgi:3-hydroxybutyryl-CoA dehydrogenase